MRKKLIAGNWKMNGSRCEIQSLIESIKQGSHDLTQVDIALFPSFVHLQQAETLLADSRISWGAQDLYLGAHGAFTGEISGPMLTDYGCQYVLVGHSERRILFHEDLTLIAAKLMAAVQFNLQPILCVGETLAQREKGETHKIIHEQLQSVMDVVDVQKFKRAVIAYEPVWAIGTGMTATPEQAQDVHAFIREEISRYDVAAAKTARIIYGGSVKADNAAGLFDMSDIDGALVGGASLVAKDFLAICQAAYERAI